MLSLVFWLTVVGQDGLRLFSLYGGPLLHSETRRDSAKRSAWIGFLLRKDAWSVVLLHVHDCSRCWRGRQDGRNELMASSGHRGGRGVH